MEVTTKGQIFLTEKELKRLQSTCCQFLKRFLFISSQRGREGDREEEKHQCVAASCVPPTGGLAWNPGTCPDWELNRQPFGSQASTQPTEPHQPGTLSVLKRGKGNNGDKLFKYLKNKSPKKKCCIGQLFDLCVHRRKCRDHLKKPGNRQEETKWVQFSDGKTLIYLEAKIFIFTCTNFEAKSKDGSRGAYSAFKFVFTRFAAAKTALDNFVFDAVNCHSGSSSSHWNHYMPLVRPAEYWRFYWM